MRDWAADYIVAHRKSIRYCAREAVRAHGLSTKHSEVELRLKSQTWGEGLNYLFYSRAETDVLIKLLYRLSTDYYTGQSGHLTRPSSSMGPQGPVLHGPEGDRS